MTIFIAIKLVKQAALRLPNWFSLLSDEQVESMRKSESASLEIRKVDPSYLDFLRKQIELGARGPEWTAILEERLKAIAPFVNKEVATLTLNRSNETVFADLDVEAGKLIRIEVS